MRRPKHRSAPENTVTAKEGNRAGQVSENLNSKPTDILEKMIWFNVNKFINETALTGQSFVMDINVTVEAALRKKAPTCCRCIASHVVP